MAEASITGRGQAFTKDDKYVCGWTEAPSERPRQGCGQPSAGCEEEENRFVPYILHPGDSTFLYHIFETLSSDQFQKQVLILSNGAQPRERETDRGERERERDRERERRKRERKGRERKRERDSSQGTTQDHTACLKTQ